MDRAFVGISRNKGTLLPDRRRGSDGTQGRIIWPNSAADGLMSLRAQCWIFPIT